MIFLFKYFFIADNADRRLTKKGYEIGCVSEYRMKILQKKEKKINDCKELLNQLQLTPQEWNKKGIAVSQDGIKRSALDMLNR